MVQPADGITVDSLLQFCLQHLKPSLGLKYLQMLIQCLDTYIHATQLRHLDFPASPMAEEFDTPEFTTRELDYTGYLVPELPVEAMDRQTFTEVRQHATKVLNAYTKAKAEHNDALAEDLREEIDSLNDYLHHNTYGKGNIRNLEDKTHSDYLLVRAALEAVRKQLIALSPDHAQFQKDHLVYGHHFMFKSGRYENKI